MRASDSGTRERFSVEDAKFSLFRAFDTRSTCVRYVRTSRIEKRRSAISLSHVVRLTGRRETKRKEKEKKEPGETEGKKEAAELRDFRNRRGSRSVNVTVLRTCVHMITHARVDSVLLRHVSGDVHCNTTFCIFARVTCMLCLARNI